MIALDENGNSWLVLKGDPAYPICSLLERKGFTRTILPRKAIMTGRVEANQVPVVDTLEVLAEVGTGGTLAQVFLDYMDLYDCTKFVVDSKV